MATSAPITESSPTANYRLNHFMLRISDPKRTLHFYTELMGMRLVFSRDVGPMTVYYLGYPQSPDHKADPEAYAQHTSQHPILTSTLGLLEFCHYHTAEGKEQIKITTGSQGKELGFNHLGFTVPDVSAAVDRLRKEGVEVVKDVGEGPNEVVPITRWEREEEIASTTELSVGFGKLFKQLGFVRDPVSAVSLLNVRGVRLTVGRMGIWWSWCRRLCNKELSMVFDIPLPFQFSTMIMPISSRCRYYGRRANPRVWVRRHPVLYT